MPNAGTPAWTLIIVPPNATSSTRRVGFKMRWFRMAGMLLLTVVTLSWVWVTAEDRLRESIVARLAAEQQTTLALRDTLQSMRNASLAERIRNSPPADMLMPVHAEVTSSFSRSKASTSAPRWERGFRRPLREELSLLDGRSATAS
jgi:hypothetical protein